MSNYLTLRSEPLLRNPVNTPDLGSTTTAFGNLYLTEKIYLNNIEISPATFLVPKITSITYNTGTSANINGYETLGIVGSGFNEGATVLIDGRPSDITTFVNSTSLTFLTPPKFAGNYSLFVVNSDGGTGASSTGIRYG